MAVIETQDTSQTQGNRVPIILLRLVIAIYVIWFILGGVRFVWSNLLYIQTGNIEQFGSKFTSTDPNYKPRVFEGLTEMLFNGLIIKGLLDKKNLFRFFAFIESGFKIYVFGFSLFSHIYSVSRGYLFHSFIQIGDLKVLIIKDWWGVPFFGTLLLISAFKIYVLSRRDVRKLFS